METPRIRVGILFVILVGGFLIMATWPSIWTVSACIIVVWGYTMVIRIHDDMSEESGAARSG